jgi:putative DNA primase/helicase
MKRRKAQTIDLLDPSRIVDVDAERECLAALIDVVDRKPAAAAEIVATLTGDEFTTDYGRELVLAVREAAGKPAPSYTDVHAALKAEVVRQNLEPGPAVAVLTELAEDKSATGHGAERRAREAAAAVRELYARRRAVATLAETLHRLHDERPMPDDLEVAAARIHEVAALAADRRADTGELVLVKASAIECTPINWLWPQRIVGDGLTIVTGPVGISKSLISVDVTARVTTGGKWPDGTGHAPQGSVILFGAEDDAGKVVVPRLAAAGADLDRVHVCQGTMHGGPAAEPESVVLERHIGQLRAALDAVTDCRLVVFDPLPDYLAADENSSREVRAALMPLARLAQERNVAVVAVLHQNKKNDLTTVQRIAGSGAFAQIARVVLAIGTHPEDADGETHKRRVMIVTKSNYGQRDIGQAYEIETRSNGQPGLVWLPGLVTMDADSLSRRPTGGREHEDRRAEAVDVLRELLEAGERSAAEITSTMQDGGLGRRQIDHAAEALNVVKVKHRDGWYWRLPASSRRRPTLTIATPDPAFAAHALDEVETFNAT